MKTIIAVSILLVFLEHSVTGQGPDDFLLLKNSRIHYQNKGNGKPAVVFVSGLGEDLTTWKTVQDSISKYTLTISYDRAGLGKSDYHGEKKDLISMAAELNQLIDSIAGKEAVILVGHSLGCQIIKKYASLFPKNIGGLIFIDPGYDERKLQANLPDSVWRKRTQLLKTYLPKFNAAQLVELDNLNTNCQMADQIRELPKVPIVLFTATRINPAFPGSSVELKIKKETHGLWLQSLPWARHVEVNDSRHYIQNDAPDIIIESIYGIVINTSK